MNKKVILSAILIVLAGFVVLSFSIFTIASIEQEVSVIRPLDKGWNLVSGFSGDYQISSDSDITSKNIKAIYSYYAPAQIYIRFYPKLESAELASLASTYNINDNNDDSLAYNANWVYSDKRGDLKYSPNIPSQYSIKSLNDYQMYVGWNFVGITSEMIGKTLNELKGNCEWTRIYAYNTDNKKAQWVDVLNNVNPNYMDKDKLNFDVENTGLVIKVSSNCKLGSPEGEVPSVPALP